MRKANILHVTEIYNLKKKREHPAELVYKYVVRVVYEIVSKLNQNFLSKN